MWCGSEEPCEPNLLESTHCFAPSIVVNSLPFKPGASERIVGASMDVGSGTGYDSNLVDSASSHTLVSKIKPCMSKYKSFTLKLRMAHYISHNLFDSPLLLGQP